MAIEVNRFALTATLVIINVVCLGLTLTLTQWLAVVPVITSADVQLFLILLTISGMICMSLILIGMVRLERRENGVHGVYHYVPYVGLYVFAIGAIVLNFLEIAACIQCTADVVNNHSLVITNVLTKKLTYDNTVYIILNIFKTLSIILQLSFLVRLKGSRSTSRSDKLCIMTLLASNASIYIFTFFQETKDKFHVKAQDHCLNETTLLQNALVKAEPYLYPFEMEFCLIAAGMLFSMLSGWPDNDNESRESSGDQPSPEDSETNTNEERQSEDSNRVCDFIRKQFFY
ncbi:uncharacterized protein [Watersipora subatra]|uniref:uncharacterized protein isoform X2 n=1 Tax=Watersipora subatra TaxID=2589382 RepID=UPI00355BD0C8